jgi:hypothetical protein
MLSAKSKRPNCSPHISPKKQKGIFFGQKFLTWIFSPKVFYGVFALPLLRNAQKPDKKI